ncbi:MAG: ABC transporter ATP-binding protein [Actinomycetota bacterium]
MARRSGVGGREELKANVRAAALVVRSAPLLVVAFLAASSFQGVAPALVVAGTGRFLARLPAAIRAGSDGAAGADVRGALLLIAGAVLLAQVLLPIQGTLLFAVQRRFEAYLARRLMAATLSLPGIAYFEDAGFRDDLEVSSWISWGPVHSLQFYASAYQRLAQIAAMAVIAATYAGWVPVLLLVASLPGGVATWRFQSTIGLARWRRSSDARRAGYYRDLAVLPEPGKEVRIFGLGSWAIARQARHWLESVRELFTLRRRSLVVALALHAIAIAALAFVYLVMLQATVTGRVDVGRFTAASMAAVGLLGGVVGFFRQASRARRSSFYLPAATRVLDLPRSDPRLDARGTRSARSLRRSGLTFEGVTFAYPGTDRPVLDRLDLWIPAGSSVALVGENGAGKTTLIKLLCRFYDPDDGRILLDGVDVREYDLASLRSRLAVIFQDFVRYKLPARDNIGFGAFERREDTATLREAASRVAILDRIESLPQGWETPLAREFGGADLSGGEWQRVALARAIMAQMGREADLLILDEPTASLDVRLEHELYGHFAELTAGRTTLLVSHRFSTVRMAERIVFLQSGRVEEDGSHEELVTAGGRYAQLYEMQAAHYRARGRLE